MGTDSSGLPWCEPGTHDHGVLGFSSAIRGLRSCLFLNASFCVLARAGERGKAFRTTTLVEE